MNIRTLNSIDKTLKQDFIDEVWIRIEATSSSAMDVVLEIAAERNIEVETAAKIVNSNAALKQLIEQQARKSNLIITPKLNFD